MFNLFKKPSGVAILRDQLDEAQRNLALYSAQAEHAAAMRDMLKARITRLKASIVDETAVRHPPAPPTPEHFIADFKTGFGL